MPRVLDTDLAKALQFENAIDIRKLVRRHASELSELGLLATVAKSSDGRPATAYYLNEAQALLVCALSRTPIAKRFIESSGRRLDRPRQICLTGTFWRCGLYLRRSGARPLRKRIMWEIPTLCTRRVGRAAARHARPTTASRLRKPRALHSYVSEILNPGISGNDLVRSVRGGRAPGTCAHWQIAPTPSNPKQEMNDVG